jgi:hypothetical protein
MPCVRWLGRLSVCCLAFLAVAQSAGAAVINYTATNVSGNLWEYNYTVSGDAFAANDAIVIFFDESLFGALSSPSVANATWSLSTLDPDTGLPAPGEFDALSLTTFASLADPFKVRAFYLPASGAPGSQHFEIDVFDANGGFVETRSSGETIGANAAVPEPGTMFLVGAGLLAARRARRKSATAR